MILRILGGLNQNMQLPREAVRYFWVSWQAGTVQLCCQVITKVVLLKCFTSHDSHGHHVKTSETYPFSSQMPYQNLLSFLGTWCLSLAENHAHPCETYRRKWKSRSVNP